MDLSISRRSCCWLLIGSLAIGAGASCRKRITKTEAAPATIAPELLFNQMRNFAGPLYQSQADSPILWQSWTRETLDHAKEANRLVFAVIALPQQRGFDQVLNQLERDPALVKEINENYVPVLIDGDASREMGILTAQLCMEIKQNLELPLMLWMTHEANPVAWIPVSDHRGDGVLKLFNQSNEMVMRMWHEDSSYVLQNSRMDNESRKKRLLATPEGPVFSEKPAEDSLQAARQLVSLYDPFSRTLDEAGGLIPAGVLETLTGAAMLPGVPETIRTRCLETTRELLKDLLPSAMFDPLEGGVFAGRSAQSWALPNFTWDCMNQARMASVLFRAHQLSGDPVALERGKGLVAFAERKFQQEDGLFSGTTFAHGGDEAWMWTVEDIEKALPAEDAKWWIAATGMKSLGNLPSEADPQRQLFRTNTLGLVRPLAETAAQLSVPPDEFASRFEQSRVKLTEIRNGRLKDPFIDRTPHAGSNFRMVTAYANAFAATGDPVYREKAIALLAKAKERFLIDGRLVNYGQAGVGSIAGGRALVYALAAQAAQDVADISLDPSASRWVEELSETADGLFVIDGLVQEVSAADRIMDLTITDYRKIFDDTSGGLFWLTDVRRPVEEAGLKGLIPRLSAAATRTPILYTDVVLAALIQSHAKTVVLGANPSPELRAIVERLPLQVVPRYSAKNSDGVPDGSVRVISPDSTGKIVSNPTELRAEFQFSQTKPLNP